MTSKTIRILITGSTGFIGQAVIKALCLKKVEIIAAVRNSNVSLPDDVQQIRIGDIQPDFDWGNILSRVDVVIHLAGRAHILNETSTDALKDFRKTNTYSTLNLAQQAADKGARRFIFISSIGVNGNQTGNKPYNVNDIPNPVGPYAISKYEAEIGLRQIASNTTMEVVIIRPPLVYGANAPGNFARLIRATSLRIPLPLGYIKNKRSLVAIDNLVDLIITCIHHPSAANQTFLVSDDEDLSTTDLLKRISKALGKRTLLIPISANILTLGAAFLGKRDIALRLCGSLQIDINHTIQTLNWKPPLSVDKALHKTAQAYLYEKTL